MLELGAGDEPTVELGGASLSLRGIPATGAMGTVDALAESPEHRDAWLKHVIELGRAGVTAFESVGNANLDRRFVKALGERALLPPRLISGALNFYMARQLAGAAMFLPERDALLERAARKCDEHLSAVEGLRSVQDRRHDIAFMRRLIHAELCRLPAAAT